MTDSGQRTESIGDDMVLERAKAFINEGLMGTLGPLVSRTFPFDRIQDTTRFRKSNEQIDKIVAAP